MGVCRRSHHRLFSGIEKSEEGGAFSGGILVGTMSATKGVARGQLDFDHLGTAVGQ
jgi:hypothetical protein